MCYLCEKYYKPITVQHYIAVLVGCLGEFCWDLWTNWMYKWLLEWNWLVCKDLLYSHELTFQKLEHS